MSVGTLCFEISAVIYLRQATLHRRICFLTITMMVGTLALFLLATSTTALASSNESDLAVDTP